MKIYILDTETTGLEGHPIDVILEIAVYELQVSNIHMSYRLVLDTVINHPITKYIKHCWIVKNGYITLEEIEQGRNLFEVAKKLEDLLGNNQHWTAFNIAFDYSKFLRYEPFKVGPPYRCLMLDSMPIVNKRFDDGNLKYPSLLDAYKHFHPELQLKNSYIQHRAAEDALMATKILMELLRREN